MWFKIFLILIILCINFSTAVAQDKRIEIVGTVVGKDRFFGHIYDSNTVNKRLLIVRIDEKLKGKIDSKYILIKHFWRLKDEKTPYRDNQATQWKFILTRKNGCDSTLEKLQFAYFNIDEKITGIYPQIELGELLLKIYRLKKIYLATNLNLKIFHKLKHS